MSYAPGHRFAIERDQSERAAFIRRTYGHLAGAILAFVALEIILVNSVLGETVATSILTGHVPWLLVLGAFMVVAWVADWWARSEVSRGLQYTGLALYVVAEAFIFLPLLFLAKHLVPDSENLIAEAGILTLCMFGGLTVAVFATRRDFSFLRPILCIASLVSIGLVVAACIFGFSLGLLFSFAMVALASAFILYDTSNVLHHYRTDQHVAAALALFASVALLFWYVLLILLQTRER